MITPTLHISTVSLQLKFPEVQLSPTEWEALTVPPQTDTLRRRQSAQVAQSVESLTHQMVVSIIGEVTRRGSSDSVPAEAQPSDKEFVQQSITARYGYRSDY